MSKTSTPDIPARIIDGIHNELDAIRAADLSDRNAAMAMAEAKQRAFEAKCRCGEYLLEAREIWGTYGKWQKWLHDNFSLSTRTANEWMEYVEYSERIDAAAPPKLEPPADEPAAAEQTPEQAAVAAAAVAAATEANQKRASHFTWRGLKAIIAKEKEKENPDAPKKKPPRAVTAKKKKSIEELLRGLEPDEVLKALRDAAFDRTQLDELGRLISKYLDSLDADDAEFGEEERASA
jgi:hypothetical protein